MFPSHHAVVAAVPEHDRYPLLDELETSTDVFAAAHPGVEVWQAGATRVGKFANMLAALLCTLVAVRERYRPAHPRPSTARIAL